MLYVLLGFLGICIGSFINALAWRIYQQNKSSKNKANASLSITKGRSMCPNCRHELAARDLIPILSWIALGGKCRYCKARISKQYPLVEILTGISFIVSYELWPAYLGGFEWLRFGCWLVLLTMLIALAVYDIKHMLLPNQLVIVAAIPVVVWIITNALFIADSAKPLLDAMYGLLAFGGVFYVLFQVSAGKWIGGGDVKLGYVLGAWLASPLLSLLAIFLASCLGTIIVAVKRFSGPLPRNTKLPFGPLLIGGFVAAFLLGDQIIAAYSNLLLPM